MNRSIVLLVATSVILIACQKAPDRHVLWTGKGVPISGAKVLSSHEIGKGVLISGAKVVSSHESKPECEKARDSIFRAVRQPDENPGQVTSWSTLLRDGTVIFVSKAGDISAYVCYPLGLNPS